MRKASMTSTTTMMKTAAALLLPAALAQAAPPDLGPLAAARGKTGVRYLVYTDPGPVPMGFGWIVDSMSKDSIPKMLEALRARVAQR
jgi:ABC-type sugar transport system substrate-binding protein